MKYLIEGYEPANIFHFFEDISKIPRSSGNEAAIADFLEAFAKERNLLCYRDKIHNVIIKKPASLGSEHASPIILQGHTDMVCEKNESTVHDFTKDALKLKVSDGFLSAEGTTLGADNGIAVALMLALLDDDTLVHPPLECVFTVQEETGLLGAQTLDCSKLSGKFMINLDSEDEGVATISCAGGTRIRFLRDAQWQNHECDAVLIKIGGLLGGHSGIDIDLGRANANKLMGRVLASLAEDRVNFCICEINGGNKDNAIPRECSCAIALENPENIGQISSFLDNFLETIKQEFADTDPNITLSYEKITAKRYMSLTVSMALTSLLCLVPNGVRSRNRNAGGFVTSSVNIGIIKSADNGIVATFSTRSSIPSLQVATKQEFARLASCLGFAMQVDSYYPGWEYQRNSRIREIFVESYKSLFNLPLKLEAIHAGLECGLLLEKIPNLDVIAVGPSVYDCHTPLERLDLHSCERFYKLLTEVLARLSLE